MDGNVFIGGGVAVIALVGLIRFFFTDRSATDTLKGEIKALRESLADQAARHAREIAALDARIDAITGMYSEQRHRAHEALNELTKAQVLLGVIIDLAERCTCGALDIISDLLAKSVTPPPERA